MSIPTSGTYRLTIAMLVNYGSAYRAANRGPLLVNYSLGSGSNTIYQEVDVTFNGNVLSWVDSSGESHTITYKTNNIMGQGNYNNYDSVLLNDANNISNYFILSNEPSGNFVSGDSINHNVTDARYWYMGNRMYQYGDSTTNAFKNLTASCFLAGAEIDTPNGLKKIEDLKINDEIYTYNNKRKEITKIIWSGKSSVKTTQKDEYSYPVKILKNSISENIPSEDISVTNDHCIFIQDNFVPVRMLVNGMTIFYDKSVQCYEYFHIETEIHSIIMANNLMTETYLDSGNRRSFLQTGNVVNINRNHNRNLTWADAAAPLNVSLEFVKPIYDQIQNRAYEAGYSLPELSVSLTQETNIHIKLKNGSLINPIKKNNNEFIFMLPPNVNDIRISSNSSKYCDIIGPYIDDRRNFGVEISSVILLENNNYKNITSYLTEENLDGWNELSGGDSRWTTGNAFLYLGEREKNNIAMLKINVKNSTKYLIKENNYNEYMNVV